MELQHLSISREADLENLQGWTPPWQPGQLFHCPYGKESCVFKQNFCISVHACYHQEDPGSLVFAPPSRCTGLCLPTHGALSSRGSC